ncbi:DUF2141 domain-containing protein [Flammeovirga sp. EKP202]|uniref:DUF2141 domain-containing protein n=1 Tax=Flammeovirga sp. EKP202 TaxID=2770592 RepID=UPI0016600041|nr:DUF2141 domain-containing protein [Flammeovirga sp. EKP202]MBD0400135.1 DUF2141 domain-containing protein [Flammeovirga sp. EKP202]
MKTLLLLSTLFFSFYLNIMEDKNTVEVTITEVTSDKGKLMIGLYNKENTFPKYEEVYQGQIISAQKGKVNCTFSNLPKGEYAIAVWHDENNNQSLDTNWVGIPKEKYGFSNNPDSRFGAPSFKKATFDFNQDKTISLTIKLN